MSAHEFKMRYKVGKARLTITQGGKTYRGPTFRQLRKIHKAGKCDAMCSYCYHEACKELKP